jgi:hypothetical protein
MTDNHHMPIISSNDDTVNYGLGGKGKEPSQSFSGASNRQKKMLRFFGIPFSTKLSVGAAGWEIATIMLNEGNRCGFRRCRTVIPISVGQGSDPVGQ